MIYIIILIHFVAMWNSQRGVRAKIKSRSIIIDTDKYNNDANYSKTIDEALKTIKDEKQ